LIGLLEFGVMTRALDTNGRRGESSMARKPAGQNVGRRKFLAGMTLTGAAVASAQSRAAAAATTLPGAAPRRPSAAFPSATAAVAETKPAGALGGAAIAPGSDFMVDVIKALDLAYVPANPASSFRGLHESLLTYGGNRNPEFITCMHEETAIGIAHGYFKIAGKPLAVLCHGTVGLQHGAMAVYNAWCDRVPVIILSGNDLDASTRPPGVPTIHSAQDVNALVRDFTKWDDTPVSLQHFAQSMMRAYKIAMTPPHGPVAIALDAGLQEEAMREREKLSIPHLTRTAPPQAEAGALREAAKLLVGAQNPVIVVDRVARTENGMKHLVKLAEALQAPVIDQGGRMNFPNTHYLSLTALGRSLLGQADVILGMELTDYWGTVNEFIDNAADEGHGLREPVIKAGTKLVSISSVELLTKSNYQDFERYQAVDLAMAADAEASLPALIEAVNAAMSADRKAALAQRGENLRKSHDQMRERLRAAAAVGWNLSPITTARLCAETFGQIQGEDWSMASVDSFQSSWPRRLWPMDRHYRHIGGSGGYGVGYGAPAAVGAALANKALGRMTVNIQSDGDLMYAPGVLWTAAHHRIPLLSVMHNNRGYHQEVMHVQRVAARRNRVMSDGPVGTTIRDPNIDYAALAKSMGVWSAGPISDPEQLGPALKTAVDVVKSGEPALVDVVAQPR
jgi:acetolactate synthase I/II/III large subunit